MRRVLIVVAIILAIGTAYYLYEGGRSELCTACQNYQARTRCVKKAAGTSAAAAERARRAACDELAPTASGRAACLQSPPTSLQCKTR